MTDAALATPWLSYSWWRVQGDRVVELHGKADRRYTFTYGSTFGGQVWTAKLETGGRGEYAGTNASSSGQTRHAVYDRPSAVVDAASSWLETEAGTATLELELVKSELVVLLSSLEDWYPDHAIKRQYPGWDQDWRYLEPDPDHMARFLKDVADYWDREAKSLTKGQA